MSKEQDKGLADDLRVALWRAEGDTAGTARLWFEDAVILARAYRAMAATARVDELEAVVTRHPWSPDETIMATMKVRAEAAEEIARDLSGQVSVLADSLLNALKVQKEVYEWRQAHKDRADALEQKLKQVEAERNRLSSDFSEKCFQLENVTKALSSERAVAAEKDRALNEINGFAKEFTLNKDRPRVVEGLLIDAIDIAANALAPKERP